MKKLLFIMVSFALVFSFLGCSNGEETPTDISSVVDLQMVEPQSQEAGEPKVEITAESLVESQIQKLESAVVSQKENTTGSVDEGEPIVSTIVNPSTAEDEPVEENLEFTTEAQLKNWFKNGTQVANAVSPEALQIMQQGSAITYLRPAISSDNGLVTLEKITVESSSFGYRYRFLQGEPTEMLIVAHHEDIVQPFYKEFETKLAQGKENYFRTTVNGIEYLYMRNATADAVVLVWKQNDVVQSANFDGHYDQINEILPLLKLESVTVQTGNQSHVTQ